MNLAAIRRLLLLAGASALCLAMPAADAAAAEPFNCRFVRIVAPNPPGGATDVLSRMIAPPLALRLGVPVMVENKGGASTNIGNEYVVRSAPDGCTLLLGNLSMALNKSLFRLNHDVEVDLRAVIQVAAVPIALFVHPSVPARTMKEFVDYARANPGKVGYSSSGNGTPAHLILEMLNQHNGTQVIHVPYRGAGPAIQDVVAGQVQASSDSLIPLVPHFQGGVLRPLGVTGKARSPVLPQVPTFAEQGYGYADISLWYGVMAPARTPAEVVRRLNEEIAAVLATPEVEKRLESLGSDRASGTPEAFMALIGADARRLGELIRQSRITAE